MGMDSEEWKQHIAAEVVELTNAVFDELEYHRHRDAAMERAKREAAEERQRREQEGQP